MQNQLAEVLASGVKETDAVGKMSQQQEKGYKEIIQQYLDDNFKLEEELKVIRAFFRIKKLNISYRN